MNGTENIVVKGEISFDAPFLLLPWHFQKSPGCCIYLYIIFRVFMCYWPQTAYFLFYINIQAKATFVYTCNTVKFKRHYLLNQLIPYIIRNYVTFIEILGGKWCFENIVGKWEIEWFELLLPYLQWIQNSFSYIDVKRWYIWGKGLTHYFWLIEKLC